MWYVNYISKLLPNKKEVQLGYITVSDYSDGGGGDVDSWCTLTLWRRGSWLPKDITSVIFLFLWYSSNFMGTDEMYLY